MFLDSFMFTVSNIFTVDRSVKEIPDYYSVPSPPFFSLDISLSFLFMIFLFNQKLNFFQLLKRNAENSEGIFPPSGLGLLKSGSLFVDFTLRGCLKNSQ